MGTLTEFSQTTDSLQETLEAHQNELAGVSSIGITRFYLAYNSSGEIVRSLFPLLSSFLNQKFSELSDAVQAVNADNLAILRSQIEEALTDYTEEWSYTTDQVVGMTGGERLRIINELFTLSYEAIAWSNSVASVIDTNLVDFLRGGLPGMPPPGEESPGIIDDIIGDIADAIRDLIGSIQFSFDIDLSGIGDAFGAAVQEIVSYIVNAIAEIAATIRETVTDIAAWIRDAMSTISDTITREMRSVLEYITERIGDIREGIEAAVTRVGEILEAQWERLRSTMSDVVEAIRTGLGGMRDAISGGVADALARIRDWMGNIIARVSEIIAEAWSGILEFFQNSRERFLEWWNENIADIPEEVINARDDLSRISLGLLSGQYDSFEALVSDIRSIGVQGEAVAALALGFLFMPVVSDAVTSAAAPFIERTTQLARREARSTLLTPVDASRALYRNELSTAEYMEIMSRWGYSDSASQTLVEVNRPLMGVSELRRAYLRQFITEDQHDKIFRKYGFTDEDLEVIKRLYHEIPPISDLIRMAVREAFTPDIAARFGQYEDFPEDVVPFAEQLGLDRTWVERYWAAHWGLPSALQGFQMLHRRIISEEDLRLLLRALDVMPWWRDHLIQLSYRPLTRVDVRRMYRLGVLNREQVYESYLDLGYSPENAERMTEFTTRYEAPREDVGDTDVRKLTRGIIQTAFRRGVISKDEAIQRMVDVGYIEEDARLIIEVQEYELGVELAPDRRRRILERLQKLLIKGYTRRVIPRESALDSLQQAGMSKAEAEAELEFAEQEIVEKLKQHVIDYVMDVYVNYTISHVEAVQLLNTAGFEAQETQELIREMNLLREQRRRKPSFTQLRNFYRYGIINYDTFINELRGLGYHEKYVNWFAELFAPVTATPEEE